MGEKTILSVTKKEEEEISGFAKQLRNKMLEFKTSWDITLDAVDYLDYLTQSSSALSFALLHEINPEKKIVLTMDMVKEKIKSESEELTKDRLSGYFSLFSKLSKEKTLYTVFQK